MARYAIILSGLVENVVVADVEPTVLGRTIVLLSLGQLVGPGDSYDGVNFTPRVVSTEEKLHNEAPDKISRQYSVLRQWAIDAAATYDAATAANRGLTNAEQREIVRRLGLFFDGVADMILILVR